MKKLTKAALIERILALDPSAKALQRLKREDLAKRLSKLERKAAKTPPIPLAAMAPPLPVAVLAPPIASPTPAKIDTRRPLIAGIVALMFAMIGPAWKNLTL